jgi:polar amino acid transport system substrate-binding protein
MWLFYILIIISTTSAAFRPVDDGDETANTTNATNTTEISNLVSFVDEATIYVKDNGKEKALQEFNNRSGLFVRGELYIFAYDFNGTNIAHPIRPDLVGHDQRGLLDINGVAVVRNELALAKRGGGTLYLVFQNPVHGDKEELKLIYLKKVDDSLCLGSGTYLSNISASFSQEERDELVAYVNEALQFARQNGKQKSLEVYNDLSGSFSRDGRYIFAYDYSGQTLALPYQPEPTGKNRTDVKDPNGVDFVSQVIDAARTGNGFMYHIYLDASRNMTPTLMLSYVVNVNDTWLLGSGICNDGSRG